MSTALGSGLMRAGDLPIAASFWEDNRDEATAIATVVVAIGLAMLVDRALLKRARHLATAVSHGELGAGADTRLRLLRRIVFAGIIVLGVALALMQFAAVKRAAAGVLASSAVLGLVVGFAARQTLANAVAGVLLAITQPIRIGDLVTFEEDTGVVEDVRLTYTWLRAEDGRRIIVPNERLASNTIENWTIVDPRVDVEVSLWLPPETDIGEVVPVLEEASGGTVEVAELDKDGVRVVVHVSAGEPGERRALAARIRAACLERLQRESKLTPGD